MPDKSREGSGRFMCLESNLNPIEYSLRSMDISTAIDARVIHPGAKPWKARPTNNRDRTIGLAAGTGRVR